MLRDRLLSFTWKNEEHTIAVPSSWPNDAVSHVAALYAGADPDLEYDLVLDQQGRWHLVVVA